MTVRHNGNGMDIEYHVTDRTPSSRWSLITVADVRGVQIQVLSPDGTISTSPSDLADRRRMSPLICPLTSSSVATTPLLAVHNNYGIF